MVSGTWQIKMFFVGVSRDTGARYKASDNVVTVHYFNREGAGDADADGKSVETWMLATTFR